MKNKNCNKAFTLIELLIVLVIIGIISAVAIPQYKILIYKSEQAMTQKNLSAWSNAIDMYYTETGHFPAITPAPQTQIYYDSVLDFKIPNSSPYWGYGINGDPNILFTLLANYAKDFPKVTWVEIMYHKSGPTTTLNGYPIRGVAFRDGWYKYYVIVSPDNVASNWD